jgi:hypothetical protein
MQPKKEKVKLTYDEYQRLALLITDTIKAFEAEQGVESVSQADIVNRLVTRLEVEEGAAGTSLERAEQTSHKIANVINHMITKENVLLIT